jgi:hypothetical protein
MKLPDKVLAGFKAAETGEFIFVLPASGSAGRICGVFIPLDLGGGAGLAPFVFQSGTQGMAIDPRAMVYRAATLEIVWHPRWSIDLIHKASAAWLRKNPDVFGLETASGVSRIEFEREGVTDDPSPQP